MDIYSVVKYSGKIIWINLFKWFVLNYFYFKYFNNIINTIFLYLILFKYYQLNTSNYFTLFNFIYIYLT